VLPAIVLACLVLTAGLSGRRALLGAVALAGMSILWLLVNKPMEGPILVVITDGRGITGGDLAGLAGLLVAAFRGLAPRHRVAQPVGAAAAEPVDSTPGTSAST
jgi:hypothetical protein